jgi:hypothetical protein
VVIQQINYVHRDSKRFVLADSKDLVAMSKEPPRSAAWAHKYPGPSTPSLCMRLRFPELPFQLDKNYVEGLMARGLRSDNGRSKT